MTAIPLATDAESVDSFPRALFSQSSTFWFHLIKRALDISIAGLLTPLLLVICALLYVLNPWFNPGGLFYVATRMGRDCTAFKVIKFRSMTAADADTKRGAECPLEHDRITLGGRILRISRVDELPQILNVLRGEMSLIGPRPDDWEHGLYFLQTVPGYRLRHSVRPGISGLAQTEIGYVEGTSGTRAKVAADLDYIAHPSLLRELWLIKQTLSTVVGCRGA
ncbi:MAG: sugar transferase [Pseudomonadota bacterium]